jgi:hypothetical protein
LPQGGFIPPEDLNPKGSPQNGTFCGERPELDLPWEKTDMVEAIQAAL